MGDWNGDGRAKIGVYSGDGYWYLDYDGNGVWDGGVLDKLVALGWAGAIPVIGDWNGDGKTKIGVYSNGFWFLDYDGNYLYQYPGPDKQVGWGWAGVTPVVGDWSGNGKTKIGVYSDGFWFLDYNGDYLWDGGVLDKQFGLGWPGATPIVGNWNGDGRTKVGVYSGGYWYVDYDGNYAWNYPAVDKVWAVGWSGTTPVIGDWSGDGKAKPGAFINGYWYLDYNGNGVYDDAVQDRLYLFGGSGDTPVVGRWTLTGGGPQVTTPSLPNGQTGVPYSQTLSASGGTPPYSWSLAAGSMPPGLTLSSGGTISGTPTTNGTYNFTARVTDGASQTGTKPLGITVSDQLTVFRNCLADSNQAVCTLPVGTYSISQTSLAVNRPNVTISGGSADRSLTKLVRAATSVDPILRVAGDSSPVSGVVIQNLTICGGSRLSLNDPNGCPRPPEPTTCGNITAGTQAGQPCVDFEVTHAAINGAQPADPFSFQGTYAVTVSNVAFEDATGHAVSLYANAASFKKVNDISITGSAVNRSEITGILAGADFGNYQPKDCDNGNFKDDGSVYSPRNLRIKNNTFIGNNTGAMGINQARWVSLRDNTFTNNYRNPQVGNEEGGTVFFDQCTDTIEIVNNRMVGPGFEHLKTQGMELWGRNITVKDNPEIRNYGNDGIQLNSVQHAKVENNVVENNNRSYPAIGYRIGGIVAWTSPPWDPPYCAPVPRDIEDIDIIRNTSTGQAYGIQLGNRGRFSRNILKDVKVTGDNILTGNNLIGGIEHPLVRQNELVGLEAYGEGLTPELITGEPLNPRPAALPIDSLSTSRRKCTAPGSSDAETFIFSASDVAGADNIDWIQGVFSIAGSDATGAGGPDSGAQGCHFIYYRSANTIYLDGPDGGSQWGTPPRSSVLGVNGTSLSNGYCTIHAGASMKLNEPNPSAPIATTPATILTLKLNIAFPQSASSSQHKHMYLIAQNYQELLSDGNSSNPVWNYWGWWATH